MIFRKAGIFDKKKIISMLVACFNISSAKEGKEIFMKEKRRDSFIIAEEDGKTVGMISWGLRGVTKHQLARISRICIRGKKDMQKIAEGLISEATQDADKYFKKRGLKLRKMYAMVRSTNNDLRRFYKKMGFVEEAKLKDHYYKGKDEYILSLFFE